MKYFFGVLSVCVLLCLGCACSTGEAASQILGASSEAPVFLSCKAVTETEITFEFSLPVKVVSLRFSPAIEVDSIEEGNIVRVNLGESPGLGEKLTADLLAEDAHGNTINVLVPLRARNSRVPSLQINELRTEYSKPKAEFIEFKILTAGNLGALRVYIAGNYKAPLVYEFVPVEVKAGEYVVLHLRTTEETNKDGPAKKLDELEEKLDESGGVDASPTARDFWVPGLTELLHKADAVYVLDQDDKVLDAVMLSDDPVAWWNKDYLADAADFLFKQDAWKTAEGKISDPAGAVNSGKTTVTRTICRDETIPNTRTAADWYITANSSATPGTPNNPKRY